jgi:hypothetical protein
MIADRMPRRRWVVITAAKVTPPSGSRPPPGVLIEKVNSPAVPTGRPPS